MSPERQQDQLEWTTRGRVFIVILVLLFLAAIYFLTASGILAELGRFLGRLWADNFVPHPSPR